MQARLEANDMSEDNAIEMNDIAPVDNVSLEERYQRELDMAIKNSMETFENEWESHDLFNARIVNEPKSVHHEVNHDFAAPDVQPISVDEIDKDKNEVENDPLPYGNEYPRIPINVVEDIAPPESDDESKIESDSESDEEDEASLAMREKFGYCDAVYPINHNIISVSGDRRFFFENGDRMIQLEAKRAIENTRKFSFKNGRNYFWNLSGEYSDFILFKSFISNKKNDDMKERVQKVFENIYYVKILDAVYNIDIRKDVEDETSPSSRYQIAYKPDAFECKKLHEMGALSMGDQATVHMIYQAFHSAVMLALLGIKLTNEHHVFIGRENRIYISCLGAFDTYIMNEMHDIVSQNWKSIFGPDEFVTVILAVFQHPDTKELVSELLEMTAKAVLEYKPNKKRMTSRWSLVITALSKMSEYIGIISSTKTIRKYAAEYKEKSENYKLKKVAKENEHVELKSKQSVVTEDNAKIRKKDGRLVSNIVKTTSKKEELVIKPSDKAQSFKTKNDSSVNQFEPQTEENGKKRTYLRVNSFMPGGRPHVYKVLCEPKKKKIRDSSDPIESVPPPKSDPFAEPEPSDSEIVDRDYDSDSESEYSEHESDREFIDDDGDLAEDLKSIVRTDAVSYPIDHQQIVEKRRD